MGKLTKGAAKTVVEIAGSMIPAIGPLVSKLGGIGSDALIDWLRGRGFNESDINILIN